MLKGTAIKLDLSYDEVGHLHSASVEELELVFSPGMAWQLLVGPAGWRLGDFALLEAATVSQNVELGRAPIDSRSCSVNVCAFEHLFGHRVGTVENIPGVELRDYELLCTHARDRNNNGP